MGVLSRFKDIMESNINALLDKCEDPAKMIDQTLRNLRESLADVKRETAEVMANDKSSAKQVSDCEAEIAKYEKAAVNALKSGNENDARTLIETKQKKEAALVSLKETAERNHSNAVKMQQMHNKLVADIEDLESRKDAIKAKVSAAKAQERMNKVMSGGDRAAAGIDAFERMEKKADKMLASAEAEAELNAGVGTTDELAKKYSSGCDASVDDELAVLKASLGMGSTTE